MEFKALRNTRSWRAHPLAGFGFDDRPADAADKKGRPDQIARNRRHLASEKETSGAAPLCVMLTSTPRLSTRPICTIDHIPSTFGLALGVGIAIADAKTWQE